MPDGMGVGLGWVGTARPVSMGVLGARPFFGGAVPPRPLVGLAVVSAVILVLLSIFIPVSVATGAGAGAMAGAEVSRPADSDLLQAIRTSGRSAIGNLESPRRRALRAHWTSLIGLRRNNNDDTRAFG
jgi:hypothetical protein